jgi:NTP pyrophosphatase (non-canonical NTP hydrolase)
MNQEKIVTMAVELGSGNGSAADERTTSPDDASAESPAPPGVRFDALDESIPLETSLAISKNLRRQNQALVEHIGWLHGRWLDSAAQAGALAAIAERAARRDWFACVRDFMLQFGQPIAALPRVPADAVARLGKRLIREEVNEELLPALDRGDLAAIADGLADSVYVLAWTALAYGIDLRGVFTEVHEANMRKVGGGVRGDGKVLKPEGWVAPDVAGVLARQVPLVVESGDQPQPDESQRGKSPHSQPSEQTPSQEGETCLEPSAPESISSAA